jgi:hypothetical protein
VSGNTLDGMQVDSMNASGRLQISNSSFSGNGGNGLIFAANVSNFRIINSTFGTNGEFTGNTSYGLYISAGTSNNYWVVGNTISGNTAGQLFDGGTGTAKLVQNVGFVNRGVITGTSTDGSGDITVTHGLAGTPTKIYVQSMSTNAVMTTNVHTVGAATFKIRFYNVAAAGATLNTFAVGNFAWIAEV